MNTSQLTLSCLLLLAAAVLGATPPCTESTKKTPPSWEKDPCPSSKPSCVLKEQGGAVCEAQLVVGDVVAIVQPESNLQGNSTEKIESPAVNSTNSSDIVSGGNSTVRTGGGSPVITTIPEAQPTQLPEEPPAEIPTTRPTTVPVAQPEAPPAEIPATRPTAAPVAQPEAPPAEIPATRPTAAPEAPPAEVPPTLPTAIPVAQLEANPTAPAALPVARPAVQPIAQPAARPAVQPIARPAAQAAFAVEALPSCTAQNRGATYCKSEKDTDRMRCNPSAAWESFPCPKLTKCVQPQKDVLRAECQPLQQPSPVCNDDSFGKVTCLSGKRVTCTPPNWSAFPCPAAEPYCIAKPNEDATCGATPDGTPPPTPPAPPTGPVCNKDTLLKYACIDGVRFRCNEIAKERYAFEPAPCATSDKCVSNPQSGAVCQGPRPEWTCARNNAYTLACAGRSGLRFLCDGVTLQWTPYPCEKGSRCIQKSRDVEPSCFSNNK